MRQQEVLQNEKAGCAPEVPGPIEPNMPRLFGAACFLNRNLTRKLPNRYPSESGHSHPGPRRNGLRVRGDPHKRSFRRWRWPRVLTDITDKSVVAQWIENLRSGNTITLLAELDGLTRNLSSLRELLSN
jgi:hypothetical protein